MARAIDVARYILEHRNARDHMTTAFALQKLLYYCQSWMLVAKGVTLFPDDIRAWQHGPVVVSVYPYCRGRHYVFPREIPEGHADALSLDERAVVDRILAMYDDSDDGSLGDGLERTSHRERPWADANPNGIITPDSMLDFYSQVQADPDSDHAAPVPDLANVADRTFVSGEEADWLSSMISD
ncbi:Panacea domain-containing protein [Bifidobacterium jacchi]|uniref:DUF4065 domain-containing protein n=1 Tax=Bifidobacterium jacchi TaxID=2490545 RepID=A0A5N5RKU6_9BIFI|nr:type II toxin-antitoxin system antitoxin SocA domain-containing protein [Bifidobacterium jacchi]KAB5607570.1 DUF4065 domain-containing protein [Bifidobacterium jacchi]